MKLIALTFLLLVSLSAQSLQCRTQMLMGTFGTICVEADKSEHIQKGFERLRSVEKALSSYDAEADIYRLNHGLHVKLQADTYEALLKSQRYYAESGGVFNIAIGAITKGLYRFGEEEQIPQNEKLDRANITFEGLRFDSNNAHIDEGIQIDLGGMGKGFGVDKAYYLLKRMGVERGSVSLSGDIRCFSTCKVEVTDPFRPESVIEEFETLQPGLGISTSGNYRRFVKNKEHHHLIDPKTKRPSTQFASVTLISKRSNSDLDAYATAASVMPLKKAIAFLERFEIAYILYSMDGSEIRSENLFEFVTFDRLSDQNDPHSSPYSTPQQNH